MDAALGCMREVANHAEAFLYLSKMTPFALGHGVKSWCRMGCAFCASRVMTRGQWHANSFVQVAQAVLGAAAGDERIGVHPVVNVGASEATEEAAVD